ncbi:hypothetical protein RDWZM_003932 [Blomia tropicalis]|uniref:Trafficking protein particle complex subunit 13-like protein n=1 Tax=Blomia tropicalis TaxID=40697 RepID=A0A9Q0MJ94_BLOTA|nr:Trafficking protein particle complex subunit 13 [Blomia tropicalis]KAJ6225387.1 hypothetical protein RDWZM_003932 [Blomia tropicalis]
MEIKLENLLSVRVGRVVSREVDVSSFVSVDEYNQYFSDGSTSLTDISLSDQYKEKWLLVPNQFFNIYLGEVFSFYITCTNDSTQEMMTNVSIQLDMQINNRAIFVKKFNLNTLDAKKSVEDILSHEIKEPFPHVLICTLGFNVAGHERQTCRKYFQFQVSKPIDVKTKSYYTECDEIYLETLFQNLTTLPIQLKSVKLESADFEVSSLNFLKSTNEQEEQWIFGKVNRLDPNESRQYLFTLRPKSEIRLIPSAIKSISAIGKLDIVWISGIGERGHIQTSQLERTTPNSETIKIFVEDIPTQVYSRTIFSVKLRIINCSLKSIEPKIELINSKHENILWLGQANRNLGPMSEAQSIEVELKLFPTKIGLHSIPLIKVIDSISSECCDFRDLASVNIV